MSDAIPHGAVDLGALAAKREAEAQAANTPPGLIKDVTAATFEADVMQQSMTVPVVLDLRADMVPASQSLSPILQALVAEDGGKWILCRVDLNAEPQFAQAFQIQSAEAIPSVFAVIKGQPLPLFQGALPKEQIRQYLDALLAEAAKNGVTGVVGGAAPDAPVDSSADAEPALDPDLEAAYDAMEQADWDAAEAAFGRLVKKSPDDAQAAIGMATASLYRRVDGLDPVTVLAAADKHPDDVELQCQAADFQTVNGDNSGAFDRLINLVKRTTGDERAQARTRLLELFEVAGPDHPAVAGARVKLANALF